MLQYVVFHGSVVENEILPILNSSSSEYLIPSVHVFPMLIFSKYVNNWSVSRDKSSEISWNILSTKLKIFCSEQLEITSNFTTFNTIAQNKNCGQLDNTYFLPIT